MLSMRKRSPQRTLILGGMLAALVLIALSATIVFSATVPKSGHVIRNEGTIVTGSDINYVGNGINCVNGVTCTVGSRWYDPLEYGAMCDDPGDGTGTNDATALQAAFDAVPTTGGGVLLPLGRCRSSASITSGVAVPVNAATTTATTGGSLANSTQYCYRATATNAIGETMGSVGIANCVLTGASGGAHTATANWYAVPGATGYKVYGRAMTTSVTLQNPDFEACTSGGANLPSTWTENDTTNSGCELTTGDGGGDNAIISNTDTAMIAQAVSITKDVAYQLTVRVQVNTGGGGTRLARADVAFSPYLTSDEVLCTTPTTNSTSYVTLSCAFISPVTRTVYITFRQTGETGTDFSRFDNVTMSSGALALMATWNGTTWSAGSGTATSWTDTGSVTPSGAMPTSSSTGGNSVTVLGQAPGLSDIVFTAAGTGLFLTADSIYNKINVRSIGIRTSQANAASGNYNDSSVGLAMTWPLGGDGTVGRTCTAQHLEISPTRAAATTAYFTVAMRVKNAWQCVLTDLMLSGQEVATSPVSTVGLFLIGSTDPALTNMTISSYNVGILYVGDASGFNTGDVNNAEGINILNSYILFNKICIYGAGDHEEPLLIVTGSHLNCEGWDILLENRREVQIYGNSFYKEGSAGLNWIGIDCANCDAGQISNNLFTLGGATGTEIGVNFRSAPAGIRDPGSAATSLSGNTWQNNDNGASDGFIAADVNASTISLRDTNVIAGRLIVAGTTEAQLLILDSSPAITHATLTGADWAVAAGSAQMCSDCAINTTDGNCGSGSTGTRASREQGNWKC